MKKLLSHSLLLLATFAVTLSLHAQNPAPVGENTYIKVCFWADHSYVSDLGFYLKAPGHQQSEPGEAGVVQLCPAASDWGAGAQFGSWTGIPWSTLGCNDPTDENTVCNSGNNLSQFCFSTHAYRGGPQLIAGNPEQTPCVCDMPTPLTGTFASVESWENIYGFDINDEGWSVQIYDCENIDNGTFLQASIHFVNYSLCDSTEVLHELADVSIPINDGSCSASSASLQSLPYQGSSVVNFEEEYPNICGISVNENNNPVIYWNSFASQIVDSVIVFAINNQSSDMYRIGAEKFTGDASFTDLSALPHLAEAEYCIGFKNICGYINLISTHQHSTYLSLLSENTNYQLQWNANESLTSQMVLIYRGTSATNLQQIASVSYSDLSYTDIFDSQGEYVYYKISCETNYCSEDKSNLNLNSNLATNDPYYFTSYVAGSTIEDVKIYPNPAKNSISIYLKGITATVEILDLSGKKMMQLYNYTGGEIDISHFDNGIYLIKLQTTTGIAIRKLIVE